MAEKRAKGPQEETAPLAQPQERPSRPPAPSQEARLDRYMKQASESMRGLSAFAGGIDDSLLTKTSDTAPAPPERRTSPDVSRRMADMVAGSLGRIRPVLRRASTEAEFSEAASGNEVPEQVVHEGDYSAVPEFQGLADARFDSYASDIVGQWLPSIVGQDIAARMSSTPAALCSFRETEDMSFGQIFMELQMIGGLGGYFVGTNAILITDEVAAYGEADARHVLLHELLHYASWLGGGRNVRWHDEGGRPVFQGDAPAWNMHEGLTELTAQEISRDEGFEPGRIGYPAESIACYYMEQLLGAGGREVLRSAYLGGDFTEVRSRLDSALGAGAFDALLSKRDSAQALSFLMGRMDGRGIDRAAWDASPIVTLARAKLEEGR